MTQKLTIIRPDDWHVHLRDGDMLKAIVGYTARQFARAIVMPNLTVPVTTTAIAQNYRNRILAAVPEDLKLEPLMTCYLTDRTDAGDIRRGFDDGIYTAGKFYPANVTTNSAHGVADIRNIYSALDSMQDIGMPLLVHGEVTDAGIDIFDREAMFIECILKRVIADFPDLKIVFEHITTRDAADFIMESGPNIAATITPHHLEFNRNTIFQGGIRPHYYCLPIAKREIHRLVLRQAATSGSSKFFLGTDSAPHTVGAKESSCGCAGLFNASCALQSYLKTFEEEGALDRFEAFASLNGPKFYNLPVNKEKITLEKSGDTIPNTIPVSDTYIVPFHAGETLAWKLDTSINV
ncbi:MAG: dihydroorotase [Hyphomonadaceae bacterium]|nr:dihydroorotase [Hyphomonadaceae bacterium]MBC6412663.1 dihydroorotase [Hyphomonadaceae bacterium]